MKWVQYTVWVSLAYCLVGQSDTSMDSRVARYSGGQPDWQDFGFDCLVMYAKSDESAENPNQIEERKEVDKQPKGAERQTQTCKKAHKQTKQAQKWAKNCEKKKKKCGQSRNKCWTKMKTGMTKRKALRQARKKRMQKVMAQRQQARNKQRAAFAAQQNLIEALRAQLKAYKLQLESADAPQESDLAEAQDGSKKKSSEKKAKKAAAEAEAAVAAAEKAAAEAQDSAKQAQKEKERAENKAAKADTKEDQAEDKLVEDPVDFSCDSSRGDCRKRVGEVSISEHGCLARVPVTSYIGKTADGDNTCTRCRPGYAFQLVWAKSRAGKCIKFEFEPQTHCTVLGINRYRVDLSSTRVQDVICTKIVTIRQKLMLWNLEDKKLQQKFKHVAHPTEAGLFVVHCNVWKQVMCRGALCDVKKEIKCANVCKVENWGKKDTECSPNLCARESNLCKETSLLV